MDLFSPQPRFRFNFFPSDYFQVLKSFMLSKVPGKPGCCELLEEVIKGLTGAKNAICVPQARVGIYLAVKQAVAEGKEIILSPNTIADVINMVVAADAKPVFCDIDPRTGNLDPDLIEELIGKDTRAILVTHLYGLMAPMAKIQEIAQKHGLIIIEDAAQAFGARQNGRWAGTIGDFGIYSFGMAKNIPSFFGGMLLAKQPENARAIGDTLTRYPLMSRAMLGKKIISCLVKDLATMDIFFSKAVFKIFRMAYRYEINSLTRLMETELDLSLKSEFPEQYKVRMTPLQAQLVLQKLDRLDKDYKNRLECARIYHEGLSVIPGLGLPPMLTDGSHIYNYYPIQYEDRIKLQLYMIDQNRDIALQHIRNTADLPAFKTWFRDCPNCRKWAQETIMMPNYAKYSLSEIRRNVETINSFFGRA